VSDTTHPPLDYDWLVVGSGFGGSVAVVERGRDYADEDLPRSGPDRRRFLWAPALGLRGIMRNVLFGHVFSSTHGLAQVPAAGLGR
jgi:cholesterol oxidase